MKTFVWSTNHIQQNTGRWVPHTIPLSYMLVNAGRRITSIPLVVDLRDRYVRQNTYYAGQQVGNIWGQWGISLPLSSTQNSHGRSYGMPIFLDFNEWEYQRQKLTWRQTAPGMGESWGGPGRWVHNHLIHQNTVYMSWP